MIAPKVSRKFFNLLSMLGLWSLFVGAFKLYARIVKPSKIIMLDGIDGGSGVCQLGQGGSPCIGAHDTGAAFVP